MNANKYIFLDIGGVLLPKNNRQRFIRDRSECRRQIARKYDDERYLRINAYDLAAAVYDWERQGIANLKTLVDESQGKIIISSSWRKYHSLESLRLLFRLYSLEDAIYDVTPVFSAEKKDEEIKAYLKANDGISDYIIIDDAYMGPPLCDRLVMTTSGWFNDRCLKQALAILNLALL